MRVKLVFTLLVLCLLTTAAVFANPIAPSPLDGTYISTDLGGGVFTGRLSESWVGSPPGYGQVGNTILMSSIYGPEMGTQWELWCASISTHPLLLTDVRDSTGTGETTWSADYTGGHFWLAADGPWAPAGSIDFTGTIEQLTATMTYLYSDGALTGVQSTNVIHGKFDPGNWDGSCVEYTISNVNYVGSTDQGPKPFDYPAFMAADCGPWMTGTGAWGDVSEITIRVFDCVQTPVRNVTWGQIRSIYRQ